MKIYCGISCPCKAPLHPEMNDPVPFPPMRPIQAHTQSINNHSTISGSKAKSDILWARTEIAVYEMASNAVKQTWSPLTKTKVGGTLYWHSPLLMLRQQIALLFCITLIQRGQDQSVIWAAGDFPKVETVTSSTLSVPLHCEYSSLSVCSCLSAWSCCNCGASSA